MARCLVTGHCGYIGSEVYRQLKEADHDVMGIDLVEGFDILDELRPNSSGVFKSRWANFRPEYIFHLAAIPRVAYSVENPIEVIENNVLSSLYVMEFARAMNTKRVIYSSSSSVRGNGLGPESPYAASKLMPESMCGVWSRLYGVDTVCLRYFNVYSPDQKASGPYATAVANWMQHIRDGKDPFITGTGEQRRDMSHKLDVVSANIFCMTREENFDGAFFDVGTGTNISLNELRDIVLKHFPEVCFKYVAPRSGDVMLTKADMSMAMEFGWLPSYNIAQGLEECFVKLKSELGDINE